MTKDYYGTKRVTAWEQDSKGRDEGYAVRDADGYTSWSPRDVFEEAYQPVDAMSFSGALAALKDGHSVWRSGWRSGWRDGIKLVLMPDRSEGWDTGTVYIVFTDATFFKWGPCRDDLTANDWQIA
jgi:hypothetical protein